MIDIGDTTWNVGDVVELRVLGALCLIDEGEADWKIIGINRQDPKFDVTHGTHMNTHAERKKRPASTSLLSANNAILMVFE